MSDIKQLAALTALNNMMAGNYFDICTVDSVASLLDVRPQGGEAYKTLRTLHCIHWAKMPQELRAAVPGLVQECLGMAPQYQFKDVTPGKLIHITPEEPQRRGVLRLLGL